MLKRNLNGTFKRSIKRFSLENFTEGYVDNQGGFRVWLPEHPRAYKGGYVLRSIAAYELYHGIQVPRENDIHHINGNRLNDSKENLEMMSHREHAILSASPKIRDVIKICKHCGKEFKIKRWRLKHPSRGQYCSQECYHKHNKGNQHKRYKRITTICQYCGKPFEHLPSKNRRFCSNRCSAKYQWNKGG